MKPGSIIYNHNRKKKKKTKTNKRTTLPRPHHHFFIFIESQKSGCNDLATATLLAKIKKQARDLCNNKSSVLRAIL
jgi:hypothetical protein